MRLKTLIPLVAVSWIAALPALPAEPVSRPITLSECIASALEHNLEIKIERFTPIFSKHDLEIARAGYDPQFTFSGTRNYSKSGGGFNPTVGTIPATDTETDTFSSSLGGLGPNGFSYSLFGNVSDNHGTRGLTVGTNIFTDPFSSSSGSVGIRMTQPLLKNFWIDGVRLNIALARSRLKSSELTLRFRIMSVVSRVEYAYYDLIAALENVKVQTEALRLAERTMADNRKKEEVGAMAPLDVMEAQTAVATAQSTLVNSMGLVTSAQNTLRNLLSDDYASVHGVLFEPTEQLSDAPQPIDVQTSWMRGLNQRPDLLQTKLLVEQQGIQLRYNKNQMYPQLDLVGSYGHGGGGGETYEFSDALDQMARGSRPFYSVGAQLSIPLSNKAARERYRSSRATAEQLLLQLKQLEQQIMVDIDNAVKAVHTSLEDIRATREASKFAEAALRAEEKKLENGKSTTFLVLDRQQKFTAARVRHLSALANYNRAQASLAYAEGATLERNQVMLDIR